MRDYKSRASTLHFSERRRRPRGGRLAVGVLLIGAAVAGVLWLTSDRTSSDTPDSRAISAGDGEDAAIPLALPPVPPGYGNRAGADSADVGE